MVRRSETFGRLLKAGISSIAYVEGKTTPAVEGELGDKIGVSGFTIQRYKAGHLPPEVLTVQVLAEACVQRGLLGRIWLEKFLQAARFPAPESLLNQICPAIPARDRPLTIFENLPAPTYSVFVRRNAIVQDIGDGLQQRMPVVLLTGFGGTGKTSLAREVASRCLDYDDVLPHFDAAVWISDKDRPGTINLSLVLDEVARTLDYPGFAQYSFEEKRRGVEQLLKRQRVLLIIDNLETVTDAALPAWLVTIPEPSKVLVTSREQHRALHPCWLVDVRGMHEDEALALITQRLHSLSLDRLLHDPAVLRPLVQHTDGNPKALELAVGLIKYERRTLQQVIDDLVAARGSLFDDLFARAWALLDEGMRRVLLVLTFFPTSASGPAVQMTADMHHNAFARASERLAELALIDLPQVDLNSPPRYTLHPLVRTFARSKLAAQPGMEADARERWLRWCRTLATQVGFCWNDLKRLDLLDHEHEIVHAALAWAFAQQCYKDTIELVEGVRYYYNVRGLWDDRLYTNVMRAEAARAIGDASNEVLALAHQVEIRSKQGLLTEAAAFLPRLEELAACTELSDDAIFEYYHALALFEYAQRDLTTAEQRWRALLPFAARLGGQKYVIARRWLAACQEQQGQLEEARQLYRESLDDARRIGDERSVCGNMIRLARYDLERGELDQAEAALVTCRHIAEQYYDRRRLAEIAYLSARLQLRRGDQAAAQASLRLAADLFERMGMRSELEAANAELVQLAQAGDVRSSE